MHYRLVFANSALHVDLPEAEVTRLLELIADPVLRWKPVPVGTSNDFLVPAHVIFIQQL